MLGLALELSWCTLIFPGMFHPSLFSVFVRKCLGLGHLRRRKFYVVDVFGQRETQEHGTTCGKVPYTAGWGLVSLVCFFPPVKPPIPSSKGEV